MNFIKICICMIIIVRLVTYSNFDIFIIKNVERIHNYIIIRLISLNGNSTGFVLKIDQWILPSNLLQPRPIYFMVPFCVSIFGVIIFTYVINFYYYEKLVPTYYLWIIWLLFLSYSEVFQVELNEVSN